MGRNRGWIGVAAVILLAWGGSPFSSAEPLGTAFSYQGRLEVADFPADGTYDFEFQLYDAASGGAQVAASVIVADATVVDGLFSLPLDFGLAAFGGQARWLEIGVRPGDSSGDYEILSPRQPISAAPYALYAVSGPGGGFWSANGNDIYNTNSGKVGIGDSNPLRTLSVNGTGFFKYDVEAAGAIKVVTGTGGLGNTRASLYNGSFLSIPVGGQLATYDENGDMTGIFGSSLTAGGYINLFSEDGGVGVVAEGDSEGAGKVTVKNADLDNTIILDGDEGDAGGDISISDGVNTTIELDGNRSGGGGGAGVLLRNSNGTTTISFDADSNDAAFLDLRTAAGTQTVSVDADDGGDGAARLKLRDGTMTRFDLDADNAGGGAWMAMANSNGLNTVTITADYNDDAAQMMLRQGAGLPAVVLYGDYEGSGKGRIVADVMEIKGGSDLSEQFDVSSPDGDIEPGMVVCIDPSKPGALAVSRQAYDRKVAGILSGAGGVEPGMRMGQDGSAADGEHPVALTGRVYCLADASHGSIEPGDLLTTSRTPGHAMKVSDHQRAQGAVIGKAMSSLETGQGLVLVLVNLQ